MYLFRYCKCLFVSFCLQDVCVISWELPGKVVLMAFVSVTGLTASVHVCPALWVRTVTAVPPTHGTSTAAMDANLASVTPNILTHPPATWYKLHMLKFKIIHQGKYKLYTISHVFTLVLADRSVFL